MMSSSDKTSPAARRSQALIQHPLNPCGFVQFGPSGHLHVARVSGSSLTNALPNTGNDRRPPASHINAASTQNPQVTPNQPKPLPRSDGLPICSGILSRTQLRHASRTNLTRQRIPAIRSSLGHELTPRMCHVLKATCRPWIVRTNRAPIVRARSQGFRAAVFVKAGGCSIRRQVD